MGFGNSVTVVGNVTRDPETRYLSSGIAVVSFGMAWNRKGKDGQDETSFFDCTAWGSLGENVASSITKGTRVVVVGELRQRSWDTPDGQKRSKVEINCDEVSPSLRWASCEVSRNERGMAGEGNKSSFQPAAPDYDDEPF